MARIFLLKVTILCVLHLPAASECFPRPRVCPEVETALLDSSEAAARPGAGSSMMAPTSPQHLAKAGKGQDKKTPVQPGASLRHPREVSTEDGLSRKATDRWLPGATWHCWRHILSRTRPACLLSVSKSDMVPLPSKLSPELCTQVDSLHWTLHGDVCRGPTQIPRA
ncbi:hypothetical protein H1C71_041956 [Ictidomys tridecemlineatus]|nr:hypothetical protein H1C71_041956 [Ictidomys tridecemlineatus]